ncbi:MAG: UbiD family decarboxylase [Planctomycetota bacterium]|nr:UbiD family decarboxylase [Planctomycetota bacterium]
MAQTIQTAGSPSAAVDLILPPMNATLRDFLKALEKSGELHRISATVSPMLEIAQIADRQSKMSAAHPSEHAKAFDPLHGGYGGKALLFEQVEGSDFPLAINTFGSYRRMELALGCDQSGGYAAIGAKIASLTKPEPPGNWREILGQAKKFMPLLKIPPKRVTSGACQNVVKLTERGEVDLTRLPIIKCWPLDGDPYAVGYRMRPEEARTAKGEGRYITFAGMHTIHADDEGVAKPASHNIGMYRAQLIDETHLVMHWHVHHDGAAHWRSWKKKGKPMPIAICFGGESVLPFAATAPLPPGLSELLMAGFLNGKGIPMVDAKTVPLRVPANSEIVIEGYVSTECGEIGHDPRKDGGLGPGAAFEGPFGDHTGFYSLPDRYPVVEVTAMTHRDDAIFPATIVGLPPQEDYYLGKATERIFLPLLQTIIPDIVDYHLPRFGCFHNCAFVKISKAYPLQARRIMHAIWGAGQMAWTKMIIVVDEEVNVHDEKAVLQALCRQADFERDIEVVNGPLDILDHAAPRLGAGHKIGFDATRKIKGEEVNGIPHDRRPRVARSEDVKLRLDVLVGQGHVTDLHVPDFSLGRMVFISVEKTESGQGAEVIDMLFDMTDGDFIVALDSRVEVQDWEAALFHLCANVDPGRDLHRRGDRIAFDATYKRPGSADERQGQPVRDWPPLLEMSEEIKRRVEARWAEYGFDT